MSLAGKYAVVTGSSRGIGRGIALKLASRGARVAVHYFRNEKAAKETLQGVRKGGSDGFLVQAGVPNRPMGVQPRAWPTSNQVLRRDREGIPHAVLGPSRAHRVHRDGPPGQRHREVPHQRFHRGLGRPHGNPPPVLREQIRRLRALTDKPFGVNVLLGGAHLPFPVKAVVDVCLEEQVAVLSTFWGDPTPYVARAHAAGVSYGNAYAELT